VQPKCSKQRIKIGNNKGLQNFNKTELFSTQKFTIYTRSCPRYGRTIIIRLFLNYPQYLKNTTIFDIPVKHHILGYFRYVDDILVVYQNNATNIKEL
jgi:hypothetical protein